MKSTEPPVTLVIMKTRGPLIVAIVLLLLPVLYAVSYLALVVPGGYIRVGVSRPDVSTTIHLASYRWQDGVCERIFWPLEQIDRQLRPDAWKSQNRLLIGE